MKKQQIQKETEKIINNDKELISILSSKPTIIFVDDLNKLNNNFLERLRKKIRVIILDESKKNVAEVMVKSIDTSAPCLFIADSNIYLHHKEERYSFGNVNVIEGAEVLEMLEKKTSETKVEILPKK